MEEPEISQPQFFSHRFDDFCAFTEVAAGWDLGFRQLDKGAFDGRMTQIISGSAQLGEVRFGRRLQQLGASPPGHWSFGIPIAHGMRYRWRGETIEHNQIIGFDSSTEMESISEVGFHLFAFSVSYEAAARLCESAQITPLEQTVGKANVAICSQKSIGAMRRIGARALATASQRSTSHSERSLEDDCLDPLLLLIGEAFSRQCAPDLSDPRTCDRSLKQALTIIHDRAHEPIGITELYRLSDASGRSLRYSFQNSLGMSPKAYLQAYRLNMVRANLLVSDPSEKGAISDAANSWGFWHLGQFAADYRQMFGELPSATLTSRSG